MMREMVSKQLTKKEIMDLIDEAYTECFCNEPIAVVTDIKTDDGIRETIVFTKNLNSKL